MNNYFYGSLIIFFIMVLSLKLIHKYYDKEILGRNIWHDPTAIIDYGLDTPGTSQQIFDIYSLSHISHGILFFILFNMLQPYWPKYFNMNVEKSFLLSIGIECLWELFENSEAIINKYRKRPEYKNYKGDSIVNSIGDIFCVILGYYLCYKNIKFGILYVIITEIVLIPFRANLLYVSIGSLIT